MNRASESSAGSVFTVLLLVTLIFAAFQVTAKAQSQSQGQPSAADEAAEGVDVGSLEYVQAQEEARQKEETVLRKPQANQGHYIALGVNFGMAFADDDKRPTRGPAYGPGFQLRLGQEIAPWLDLGLAFAFSPLSLGDNVDELYLGRVGIQAQLRVDPKWYVLVGFGAGGSGGTDPQDKDFDRGRFGAVFTLGGGYNIYLSSQEDSGGWLLSPNVGIEIGPDPEFVTYSMWVGLELSHWFGLAKRKLDLPIDEAYENK